MSTFKLACVATIASLFVGACDGIVEAVHGGGGRPVASASAAPPDDVATTAPEEAETIAVADTATITLAQSGGPGPAPSQAAQPAQRQARFTVDTLLRDLSANPQAKAIVDNYAPGITEGPHAVMAGGYSLRQIQAQMAGMISEAELNQMSTELAAIP